MSDEKPLILIVEDNDAHIELISRSLEGSNLNIDLQVCKNILDAKKVINTHIPDLVIADLNLPDGMGSELISVKQGRIVYPIILMTSFGDENIAVDAIKAGALDYLVKTPEIFSTMPKLIERALREWSNIDAKQKAQQALLEKEFEQREILSSIMDAVITIDENSNILTFNKIAEKLFQYDANEIIGTSLLQIIPEAYKDRHVHGLKEYMSTGNTKVIGVEGGAELEAMRKDKSIFPMRLSVGELPASSTGIKRFIGICQDLTQLKQQEEQLRRSQKMEAMGKLTGGIAHDYNNMLGVVLGYAEILESMSENNPELLKHINEITHAGERGVKLTKKLLSFSRLKSSVLHLISLNDILIDEQDMLEKTLTARIKLSYNLTDESCLVKIDSSDFEDAIVNICINAMHAIEGNGDLDFQTRVETLNQKDASILQIESGDYVLLSISDTGKGMDAATKEQIFEPFFSTKGELGTGLGLSQVYGFVNRCAGAITVYSEEGLGTNLTLYFPRFVDDKADKPSKNEQKNTPRDFNGTESILVVDDEISLITLTSNILGHYGYKVFCAESGKQALAILENENIDLVFSDVIMPEMDGFQLAKIIQEKYPDIKIQLASGFSDMRHEQIGDTTLHKSLLNKPYNSKSLLVKIRDLLDS